MPPDSPAASAPQHSIPPPGNWNFPLPKRGWICGEKTSRSSPGSTASPSARPRSWCGSTASPSPATAPAVGRLVIFR